MRLMTLRSPRLMTDEAEANLADETDEAGEADAESQWGQRG